MNVVFELNQKLAQCRKTTQQTTTKNTWKNKFCQLLNLRGVNDVSQ